VGKIGKLYERARNNKTSQDSPMAKLLAQKFANVDGLRKGDKVKGKITKITREEILVDINSKAEAVVLEKDKQILQNILSSLKVGDEVVVTILNPEAETGNAVVSLRRFMEERAWRELKEMQKNQALMSVIVVDVTKGGYVVTLPSGMSGFLPYSHTILGNHPSVGKQVEVYVLEVDPEENRIVVSQKRILSDEELELAKKTYKKDTKVKGRVETVTSFGIFTTLPVKTKTEDKVTIDGLVHISEIAWEKVSDLTSLYKVGDEFEAIVIGFDDASRRVDLSIKRLLADPFEETVKRFPIDTKVQGTVAKIIGGNVHVMLDDQVEGIIRKEKVPPTISYTQGQQITVLVSDIDTKHRQINLTPVLLEKPIGYR
jgi:small subunit ribosomal protein S1